jgi:hypothetical protein
MGDARRRLSRVDPVQTDEGDGISKPFLFARVSPYVVSFTRAPLLHLIYVTMGLMLCLRQRYTSILDR